MNDRHCDIIIIGAGLTGLTLAYLLRDQPWKIQLIEARPRIGGRIYTSNLENKAPVEHEATWLGKKHTALNALLNELELPIFEQILGKTAIYEPISTSPPQLVQLPPNDAPSYRIAQGSSTLINALVQRLGANTSISTEEVTSAIGANEDGVVVTTNHGSIYGKIVVSTLPPYLFHETINCNPTLPDHLQEVMQLTHTWMGESIKVALHYDQPFWRSEGLSGTIFSNVGPVPEMYDHADVANQHFALKGFLNGAYFSVSKQEREQLVLQQLRRYFGKQADTYTHYEETVWQKEVYTYAPYRQHLLPHQHNGHPVYRQAYLQNRLYLAGSETAPQHPGYMDGAVSSAQSVAEKIQSYLT